MARSSSCKQRTTLMLTAEHSPTSFPTQFLRTSKKASTEILSPCRLSSSNQPQTAQLGNQLPQKASAHGQLKAAATKGGRQDGCAKLFRLCRQELLDYRRLEKRRCSGF